MNRGVLGKRTAICFLVLLLLMFLTVIRLASIMTSDEYLTAANEQSTRRITVKTKRGTIFSSNMTPLTNSEERYATLITDEPEGINMLSEYLSQEEMNDIIKEIRASGFAVRTLDREIKAQGLYSIRVKGELDSQIANHIVGYVNGENHGVSGLQAAYDDLLYSTQKAEFTFSVDGHGNILKGSVNRTGLDYTAENSGIMTTIDVEIQKIVNEAMKDITCGAAIVTEVKSGKIRAMVSRPDYDINNLAQALNNQDSPLINRCLYNYNVGSVFKPLVAAAGIESNKSDFMHNCVGYSDIDGLIFACHKLSGHSWVSLRQAIKYSCNTYFYDFAAFIGADRIYKMAQSAGFDGVLTLAQGIKTEQGKIGNLTQLGISNRAVANLAIGQGELMVSPLALSNLYMAIANDGSYKPPTLIEGTVTNGELKEKLSEVKSVRLMEPTTALILRSYLSGVLEEDGTGFLARPTITTAAGKTGTAQTGMIKDGKRTTNAWFCGFFPKTEPKYTVIILAENANSGCTLAFSKIADEITRLSTIKQ